MPRIVRVSFVVPHYGFVGRRCFFVAVVMMFVMCALFSGWARAAASGGPAWEISSVAHPTNFSMEDNAKCGPRQLRCDQYVVTLTNVGSEPANGVTIVDTLPRGLKPVGERGENLETGSPFSCGIATVGNVATATCAYGGSVAPDATLALFVEVEVEATAPVGEVTNVVTVSGGGAPPVSTGAPLTLPNTVGGPPAAFGISAFGFAAHEAKGLLDTQAGGHPFGMTSTVNLNTSTESHPEEISYPYLFASVEPPRDIVVYLPLGFLGDPTAAARCTELQIAQLLSRTECPAASRVGTFTLFSEATVFSSTFPEGSVSSIYNMVPEAGFPAQFGFKAGYNKPVPLYVSVVHTPSGYALRAATAGIPRTINIEGAALTFFGDPRTADGEPNSSQPFFTNPADCSAGPLQARVQVDSWVHPHRWVSGESVAYPQVTGCDLLQFAPLVEVHPEVSQAEAPSGDEIKIRIPQSPERFPVLATPQLKNVTFTFPEGMTISPGGGGGLRACEATGPNGIDMPTNSPEGKMRTPTEVGEGEALGPDDMTHLVAGHCPHQSQIGTVEIVSPVLASPLEGRLYVAQPQCGGPGQSPCTAADASNGSLFGVYLEAEGGGAVVKLRGSASVNSATGQLTARFLENPQLPVSEVTVHLKGGGRALLANPRQCGEAVANADLAPWSSPVTPDSILEAPFPVDWDGHGGACPVALPFAPTLEAGATSAQAEHFTPFTLTVARGDRQQDLARVQVKMPVGLLGMLSKVALCEEPQASQGTCPEASKIGTTWVAVGSGPQPLWVQGRVYLTGSYAGAPFGLSIVVPAVAGPFNLGNVVVRSRIDVDPNTGAVTITSDPLPRFLDGVPVRIQKLNVAVDREGFIFNPTNCTAKQIEATLESTQGTKAVVSSPFAVEGCKNLPFKPTFKVSTEAKTSKAHGASLDVKVTSGSGQANVGSAVVSFPKQLPARLTTLQQACSEATFAQNPALCPAGSNIGTAKVLTPVLNAPLTGPAYLVSHGGAAFPDVVMILQGQGVRLDLTFHTNIAKGITTSTLPTAPDAPITSFEVKLPEGPHSALTAVLPAKAKGNLCATKLSMPTTLTGQNGAQFKQSTKITITGCPKTKKKTKHKKH
jgi:hypothetical protein